MPLLCTSLLITLMTDTYFEQNMHLEDLKSRPVTWHSTRYFPMEGIFMTVLGYKIKELYFFFDGKIGYTLVSCHWTFKFLVHPSWEYICPSMIILIVQTLSKVVRRFQILQWLMVPEFCAISNNQPMWEILLWHVPLLVHSCMM